MLKNSELIKAAFSKLHPYAKVNALCNLLDILVDALKIQADDQSISFYLGTPDLAKLKADLLDQFKETEETEETASLMISAIVDHIKDELSYTKISYGPRKFFVTESGPKSVDWCVNSMLDDIVSTAIPDATDDDLFIIYTWIPDKAKNLLIRQIEAYLII